MKKGDIVKCIDDKNQPEGACVVEGQDYVVISSRMNDYGQRIVFLEGVPNNGRTSKGLEWNGYNAKRFGTPINSSVEVEETEFATA
jgi:hypothetical protein